MHFIENYSNILDKIMKNQLKQCNNLNKFHYICASFMQKKGKFKNMYHHCIWFSLIIFDHHHDVCFSLR